MIFIRPKPGHHAAEVERILLDLWVDPLGTALRLMAFFISAFVQAFRIFDKLLLRLGINISLLNTVMSVSWSNLDCLVSCIFSL